jgi:hypothetical protein
MKTTVEIPDDLFRQAKAKAALEGRKLKDLFADGLRQALASSRAVSARPRSRAASKGKVPSYPLVQARGKGKLALTNEIIAELDDEDLVRGAFGGRYRFCHAPVSVSEGNEIRPLTNEQMARLFEHEEALRSR